MSVDFLSQQTEHLEAADSGTDMLMSLMGMSPYVWQDGDTGASLVWQSNALTASLFCSRPEECTRRGKCFVRTPV